jgi:ankyrin repeat protein
MAKFFVFFVSLSIFTATCQAAQQGNIETKWVGGPLSLPEFHQHAHFNRIDKLEKMLDNGQDIHAHESEDGRTALLIASKKCHLAGVKLLLSKGADVGDRDLLSRTPLIEAASNCNVEMLSTLVSAGARVDDFDEFGHTSLMAAAHVGHMAGVRYLIESGADADVRSKSEPGKPAKTAAQWAREAGFNDVADYLEGPESRHERNPPPPTKRPELKPTPTKKLDEGDDDMKEL